MTPFIQQFAQYYDISDTVNGTWVQAIAEYLAQENESELLPEGDLTKYICNVLDITEPVNGTWIQALSQYYMVNDTANSTWLQGIVDSILYVQDDYVENGYVA